MKQVTIYTDGGCDPNPGPGGWGAVLIYAGVRRELQGGERATTNNRMEMTAAIRALETLKESCEVRMITDSEYLRNGITQWMTGWKAKGWKTSTRQPVKNQDLWIALDAAVAVHTVKWEWTRGHSGNRENERCHRLAAMGRREALVSPK